MPVPTRRAAILLALAAPVALVIGAAAPGAWIIAPLLGLALIVLIGIDAALAGSMRDVSLALPEIAEVGAAVHLPLRARGSAGRVVACRAVIDCDARLAETQQAQCNLSQGEGRIWQGAFALTPARRGTGAIESLWLRWTGPMGLGARQAQIAIDESIAIRPNVALARSPALQTWLRDARIGLIARRIRGEGAQFEALTDYQPGMDRRRIDWKSSARHMQLYAKEYEAEKNNPIVFAFDCGQAMCEPIDGMPRIDRAVSAALAAAWVALKAGDRVALFGFAARPQLSTPFYTGTPAFAQVQRAAAELDYSPQEPNFTLALATLAEKLERRSLIVVFSDFTDPTSAELMIESIGRLTQRHLVLFVTMEDVELEGFSHTEPDDMGSLAMAVTADSLLRQRELVHQRLRQRGVDVIEAPHDAIGMRLIDAYLAIKRSGAIG